MPLLSFFASTPPARAWSVPRAAAYGAGIGALAALFKTFGPAHAGSVAPVIEIAGAAAAFALLCAGAAALRNLILQRLPQ